MNKAHLTFESDVAEDSCAPAVASAAGMKKARLPATRRFPAGRLRLAANRAFAAGFPAATSAGARLAWLKRFRQATNNKTSQLREKGIFALHFFNTDLRRYDLHPKPFTAQYGFAVQKNALLLLETMIESLLA